MPKDHDLSPEDRALFRKSIAGTIPLGDKRPTALPVKKSSTAQSTQKEIAHKHHRPKSEISLVSIPLSDHSSNPVAAETLLEYSASGLSNKDMRRLKTGEFRVQSSLDLHGYTADEARYQILRFLEKALAEDRRCIRIVHGKGKHGSETPILKNLVNTWLRQLPPILAFCSAPPRDGGAGAVTVLLKPNN